MSRKTKNKAARHGRHPMFADLADMSHRVEAQRAAEALRAAVQDRFADAASTAKPTVIETMDAYLGAALNAVCTFHAVDHLLDGFDGDKSDVVLVSASAALVAAYLQGAASLHAAFVAASVPLAPVGTALMQGGHNHA